MTLPLYVLCALVLGVLVGVWRAPHAYAALRQDPSEALEDRVKQLESVLGKMQREIDSLPTIWEDYADRVAKSEKRIEYHTRRRVEAESRGDDQEAIARDLPRFDGARGGTRGMPSMHEEVERAAERAEETLDINEIRRRVALGLG